MWRSDLLGLLVGLVILLGGSGLPAADDPPTFAREFRAAWVATVGNIDWPSRPGLSTDDQKREAVRILDRAARKVRVV